jgi:hypothetical protein
MYFDGMEHLVTEGDLPDPAYQNAAALLFGTDTLGEVPPLMPARVEAAPTPAVSELERAA